MPEAATAPRQVHQSAADWYKAKYPEDAADIERWTKTGEIAIVEQEKECGNYGINSSNNRS